MPVTVLSFPTAPAFQSSTFGLRSNTQIFTSPLNGTVQTQEMPGARWFATYTLPPMHRELAAKWCAFLVQLRGQANRFYAYDPDARSPRGTATTATVNGANQTGAALVVDGMGAGKTLLKGDYIAFDTGRGRELHMIVADATANASGQATLVFEPPIRNAPADNATVILTDPSCLMMLDSPDVAWNVDAASIFGLTFSAIEATV